MNEAEEAIDSVESVFRRIDRGRGGSDQEDQGDYILDCPQCGNPMVCNAKQGKNKGQSF